MIVAMLVAADEKDAMGYMNKLPWYLPADMKYFKDVTRGHHMLMGRRTFESLGKPLPERVNIVLTSNREYAPAGAVVVNTLKEGIDFAANAGETELFVIGGAVVFKEALPLANRLYLTRIHAEFAADTFLPFNVSPDWKLVSRESHQPDEKNKYAYTFEVYELKPVTATAP